MFRRNEDNGIEILASFLIGGIVGAGLALLFAPQSGRKTRSQIRDLAEDATDYASDYARKLKKKVS
ncbi:MAG: YtxH domain-containing protein [Nitrospiraceae bacterium]|nr:YtxH domain-containing protein [Nitrospiraceae bacterium]